MTLRGLFEKFFRHDKYPIDVRGIEAMMGYSFTDKGLLFRSLKHRSYSQEKDGSVDKSNERLEFLGDSVLNLLVSHLIFEKYPKYREGSLTKIRSSFVSGGSLSIAGKKLGIDKYVLLSESEEDAGGRNRESIIADAYEAMLGAIYLDGGIKPAMNFIKKTIMSNAEFILEHSQFNYKSYLLEFSQSKKLGHPVYRTLTEDGPDHDKNFTVQVLILNNPCGTGSGEKQKGCSADGCKGLSRSLREKGAFSGRQSGQCFRKYF